MIKVTVTTVGLQVSLQLPLPTSRGHFETVRFIEEV